MSRWPAVSQRIVLKPYANVARGATRLFSRVYGREAAPREGISCPLPIVKAVIRTGFGDIPFEFKVDTGADMMSQSAWRRTQD